MSSIRERTNLTPGTDNPKDSPVNALMRTLIDAADAATDAGYDPQGNVIPGNKLFDTVKDGNNTTSEDMNANTDGVNLRLYRTEGSTVRVITQGLFIFERLIPITFCPTFGFMLDSDTGEESIDNWRENLRLATERIYAEKNLPHVTNTWRTAPLKDIPEAIFNYTRNFEKTVMMNGSDNWYSSPFTLFYLVNNQNFI